MLASTSAVQQMIGASGFTEASPVSMPTFVGAEDLAQREELLAHQRLDRRGVEAAPGRRPAPRRARPIATSDFPDPVGVARTTLLPAEQLEDRLVLVRVERQPLRRPPSR